MHEVANAGKSGGKDENVSSYLTILYILVT